MQFCIRQVLQTNFFFAHCFATVFIENWTIRLVDEAEKTNKEESIWQVIIKINFDIIACESFFNVETSINE